ncbi:MAG: hypothetical protein CMH59_16855, partial [Myxococcales bacterium]|nr:hypothetical protein [Myxococcales bacterium]
PDAGELDDAGVADGSAPDGGIPDGGTDAARPPPPPRDGGTDAGADGGRDAGRPPDVLCEADTDCPADRLCRLDDALAGEDLAPAPLVCGEASPAALDFERCDLPADCARGLCLVAGVCTPPCLGDADCGPGLRCREVHARTAARALQPFRGCVPAFVPPAGATVEAVAESLVAPPGGEELAIPLRAPGMEPTLHLLLPREEALVFPLRLTSGGEVLSDAERFVPGEPPPRNPVVGESLVTVLLPNAGGAPPAGPLELTVVADGRTTLDLFELRGGPRGRRLDVDVFYVGGGRLRPAGEAGPPRLASALRGAMARLGLRLGRVHQHEVVGALRGRYGILEAVGERMPELGDLFALSAGAPESSVALFVVRDMELALGISGGIPGPWTAPGTRASGVAVAFDLLDMPGFPLPLERVLAHEFGHYLGLFHTTEADGTRIEPLGDTPACPVENDADGDGFLLPEECVGAGGDNLMFWAAGGDGLSAEQRGLVRRALLLR